MKKQRKIANIICYAILILGGIFYLLPFYWMVRSSLMNMVDIFKLPPIWIPKVLHFENYVEAINMVPFWRYLGNTLTILIPSIVGILFTSSLAAYAFSRLEWPGRNIWFGLILSGMMMPYAVTLVPTFIGWKSLGFYGTYVPLIVPSWLGGGAFNIFLLRQFCMTIPRELDEAALIDGAGHFRIYTFIILPLIKSAMIVVALFSFVNIWNDFLGPLVYLKTEKSFTLSLGLQQFVGQYTAQWHYLMAMSTLVVMPTLVLYLIGQKYFIEGISMTGLKA